jgi:hypothetical protein
MMAIIGTAYSCKVTIPLMAHPGFHLGATGFGLLYAATGAGAVVSGITLAGKVPGRVRTLTMRGSTASGGPLVGVAGRAAGTAGVAGSESRRLRCRRAARARFGQWGTDQGGRSPCERDRRGPPERHVAMDRAADTRQPRRGLRRRMPTAARKARRCARVATRADASSASHRRRAARVIIAWQGRSAARSSRPTFDARSRSRQRGLTERIGSVLRVGTLAGVGWGRGSDLMARPPRCAGGGRAAFPSRQRWRSRAGA